MRNIFIILVFLSLLNCKKNPLSHNEKHFDPQNLSRLSLEEVNHFWQGDRAKDISIFIDANFNSHIGFLEGISYRGDKRGLSVSVFKSQAMAIEAMELRRNNVAAIIEPGNPTDLFAGKWWFSENVPHHVFVNQWNTIVEVFFYDSNYEEVKPLLIETAREIARRIDVLSD